MMNYLCIPATLKQQTFPCKNRNKLTFSDQKHIPISCLFLLKEKKNKTKQLKNKQSTLLSPNLGDQLPAEKMS